MLDSRRSSSPAIRLSLLAPLVWLALVVPMPRVAAAQEPVGEEPTAEEERAPEPENPPERADGEEREERPRGAPATVERHEPPEEPPPVEDVRVDASLVRGVTVEAPTLAGLKFEAHLAAWVRYQGTFGDAPADQFFSVPLVRPLVQASAFDGLVQVMAQVETAGSPALLDLMLDIVPADEFHLRIGQFRTPFSRAFITPIIKLQLPTRGSVVDHFRANRDVGLMVSGVLFDQLEYFLGVFNGNGINTQIGNTPAPMTVGRLAWTPWGHVPYDQAPQLTGLDVHGLSIGVDGYWRQRDEIQSATNPADVQTEYSGSVDLAYVHGPFALHNENFLRHDSSIPGVPGGESWGTMVQAGLFVLPQIIEVVARASWINPRFGVGGDFIQIYEGGLNGYFYLDDTAFGHHLKLSLVYRFSDNDGTTTFTGNVFPGTNHFLRAQVQFWM